MGGLFLIAKATHEMHAEIESVEEDGGDAALGAIMRAIEAGVSLRGSQVATTFPWRSTVAAEHSLRTSSRRCEI